jgi:hypothetical protein
MPNTAVCAWADFLPRIHFTSHSTTPLKPPETMINSIITNTGGMKARILRFPTSAMVVASIVPAAPKPSDHDPTTSGASGT